MCHGAVLGVEVDRVYDGVLFWQCMACGYPFQRFDDKKMRALAEPHIVQAREDWSR